MASRFIVNTVSVQRSADIFGVSCGGKIEREREKRAICFLLTSLIKKCTHNSFVNIECDQGCRKRLESVIVLSLDISKSISVGSPTKQHFKSVLRS